MSFIPTNAQQSKQQQVVYTRGPLLWRAATSPGRLLAPRNEFSQAFSPRSRAVLNVGQLLGQRLYVTAEGSYAPKAAAVAGARGGAAAAATMPVDIVASIERGALHVLGARVPLPIRGSGEVQLAYLGGPVRVFRAPSTGSVTVQVRRDELQRLLDRSA